MQASRMMARVDAGRTVESGGEDMRSNLEYWDDLLEDLTFRYLCERRLFSGL